MRKTIATLAVIADAASARGATADPASADDPHATSSLGPRLTLGHHDGTQGAAVISIGAGRAGGSPIERWVIERVAFYLDCSIRDVDPMVPLAETGIDSASAVGLCGDVEDHWRIDADPTLVFDYPTIAEIAGFIAEQLAETDRLAA
jgi:acyl carrier protein